MPEDRPVDSADHSQIPEKETSSQPKYQKADRSDTRHEEECLAADENRERTEAEKKVIKKFEGFEKRMERKMNEKFGHLEDRIEEAVRKAAASGNKGVYNS